MYEYNGKGVWAYYINKVIYNTYLTDKERYMISMLDYFRLESLKTPENYPHLGIDESKQGTTKRPVPVAVSIEETPYIIKTENHIIFWSNIMQLQRQIYTQYVVEYRNDPKRAMTDLKLSLKDMTPAKFYREFVAPNPKRIDIEIDPITYIKYRVEAVCEPMLRIVEYTAHEETAQKLIDNKVKAISDYIEGKKHGE